MKHKLLYLSILSLLVFLLGLAASLTLNTFILWANLEGQSFWGYPEALTFDSSLTTAARLSSLRCPVILTSGEAGTVDVKVRNPNDYPIEAWVSAHISKPGEDENMVRDLQGVPLSQGESAHLRWAVTRDNVIRNRMIIARVFLRLTERHPPARTKHCGILLVDLGGLSGRSITLLALVGGHVLQAGGILLWQHTRQTLGKKTHMTRNVLITVTALSLVMTFGSFTHSWVFSMLALLLGLLIVFTTVGYRLGISNNSAN
ncbi:MAG: hypothetical protein ACNA70_02545 [Brevefilum sp.]